MSQTVADVLVEALEQIGVTHIFGLIGDSLILSAMPSGVAKLSRWASGMRKAGRLPPPDRQSSPAGLGCVPGELDMEATISSPAFMRRAAIMPLCLRFRAICRASFTAQTTFRLANPISFPRRLAFYADDPPRTRRRPLFIKPSQPPMRDAESRI